MNRLDVRSAGIRVRDAPYYSIKAETSRLKGYMATKKKVKRLYYTANQKRIIATLTDRLDSANLFSLEMDRAFKAMQGEWQIARAQALAHAAQVAQLQHKLTVIDLMVTGKTVPAIIHLLQGPRLDIGVQIAGPCESSVKHAE